MFECFSLPLESGIVIFHLYKYFSASGKKFYHCRALKQLQLI